MSKFDNYTMSDWRDYYEAKARKADNNYQLTGDNRYDTERYKYDMIVKAFDGYLEHRNEEDSAKRNRIHNINVYAERHLIAEKYTRQEVLKILDDMKQF